MKYSIILLAICAFLISFTYPEIKSSDVLHDAVHNMEELNSAISKAQPGDNIVMANGVWNDAQIRFIANGSEGKPITLKAETAGKVLIKGESDLKFGGDYLTVDGLYFVDGFSPTKTVVDFAMKGKVANHCILTNCVIKDYNKLQRNFQDLWILIKGRHNQIDHCYLTGKSNRGPTVRVDLKGNESINNHHKIINNHFGPRPPKGGPSAETIQIGDSYTSMCPSYTLVANNLFERCNGEVEVISSKTNFNEFRNNVFFKSEGSLVTRHGNYCTVDGNYFIGDETTTNVGGVRLIGTGHVVTNNYFYNLRGQEFRSPLAVMNGIPKSPLNRYIQVTDVVIAHNSWINCVAPLQFGVGSNVSQKDVLPASEIRSARPIRTVVANNLIHNTVGDKSPIVAHDLLDGIQFESNVISNEGVVFENVEGVAANSFDLEEIEKDVWAPAQSLSTIEVYQGFEFDQFDKDLFGASRSENNSVGAIAGMPKQKPSIMDRSKYGTDWHVVDQGSIGSETHKVNPSMDLAAVISKARNGDVIELVKGSYTVNNSLKINKKLSIKSASSAEEVTLNYKGIKGSALFEMNPKGELSLNGLMLIGDKTQNAFASLKEKMSSLYNLNVVNCKVEGFDYILKAYKYSFAEHIVFTATSFKNCNNGIELSEETEDKGEYNAENISITECTFENIDQNVIDYYRGGYDESTVGGVLSLTNSKFKNCGKKEKSKILLSTYGIINVDISGNSFIDNEVKLVVRLWGAKNNTHSKNTIKNSGEIVVEENLKLNLLY